MSAASISAPFSSSIAIARSLWVDLVTREEILGSNLGSNVATAEQSGVSPWKFLESILAPYFRKRLMIFSRL